MTQDGRPEATPRDTHAADSKPKVPQTHPAGVPGGTSVLPEPGPTPAIDTGYTESGVPTFEGVREKIETRYGTALGATELAEETAEVRTAEQRYAARQKAAADKLEEIRASMHDKPE